MRKVILERVASWNQRKGPHHEPSLLKHVVTGGLKSEDSFGKISPFHVSLGRRGEWTNPDRLNLA